MAERLRRRAGLLPIAELIGTRARDVGAAAWRFARGRRSAGAGRAADRPPRRRRSPSRPGPCFGTCPIYSARCERRRRSGLFSGRRQPRSPAAPLHDHRRSSFAPSPPIVAPLASQHDVRHAPWPIFRRIDMHLDRRGRRRTARRYINSASIAHRSGARAACCARRRTCCRSGISSAAPLTTSRP